MKLEKLTPEFILSEVKKLQYLYGLKHEIRYGQSRPEGDLTESVAEHIYGMHLLAHYFLPLEDPNGQWDRLRIFNMITTHDLDELETGDTISWLKTPAMYAAEEAAALQVVERAPANLQRFIMDSHTEYNTRTTVEAKFVKAIDAFEPLVQVYSPFGRGVMQLNKPTPENNRSIKDPHIIHFKVMWQYYEVLHQALIDEGYFDYQARP